MADQSRIVTMSVFHTFSRTMLKSSSIASQYTKAGKNWKEGLDGNETEMLQSTFMLRRQPSGGHLNNGIRRIVYDNGYSIKRVK